MSMLDTGRGGRAGPSQPAVKAVRRPHPRSITDRRVLGALLVLALAPFVVSAITVLAKDWGYASYGDVASTEAYVRDVGRHAVLLGPFSRYGWFHPGPALFYVLAPFYWVTGGRSVGLMLGALVTNAAAVVGIVLTARRRGGLPLALVALTGTLALAHALGAEWIRSAWNPVIVILPLVLLVFLMWSLCELDVWALPVGAFVASFVVQTHVGYTLPCAALVAAGGVGLAIRTRRARREPGWLGRRSDLITATVIAALVAAVMWLPPVYQELTRSPGNFGQILDFFRHHRPDETLAHGVKAVARQLSVRSSWATGAAPTLDPRSAGLYLNPGIAIPIVGIVLVAAGAAQARVERRTPWFPVLAVVALAAVAVAISRVVGVLYLYIATVAWPVGMVAAVAAVWALWSSVTAAAARKPTVERAQRTSAGPLAGVLAATLVALCVVLCVSSADADRVNDAQASAQVRAIMPALVAAVRGAHGTVLLRSDDPFLLPTFVVVLERQGVRFVVAPEFEQLYPSRLRRDRRAVTEVLTVTHGSSVPRYQRTSGYRLVAGHAAATIRPTPAQIRRIADLLRRVKVSPRSIDRAVEQLRTTPGNPSYELAAFLSPS